MSTVQRRVYSLLLLITLELPAGKEPYNKLECISDQQNDNHDDLNQ